MKSILFDASDPAEHLALDEAMLLEAEAEAEAEVGGIPCESIRFWQFDRHVVVLGRSSRVDIEVDREFCDRHEIPIMRRCSGGAAVVGGPGCLMYSLVLSHRQKTELKKIDAAHEYVMTRIVAAIRRQVPDVRHQGICDVTYENRKCSGNSLRIAREHLLYHGTVLYDADLRRLAECLRVAPRQPNYRQGRDHRDFVTNLPVDADQLRADLSHAFGADSNLVAEIPSRRIAELRRSRYDDPAWHLRH